METTAGVMWAAVLHGPGDLRVEQVPLPAPGPGEVLLEVVACGVCGSDLDRALRKGSHRTPLILGHEFSGHVRELGPGVDDCWLGALATVPPLIPCRACAECLQGEYGLCSNYSYFGSRVDGAYASSVVVPTGNLVRLPDDLDPRLGAMVDPAAVALHAIWRTSVRLGDSVAVVGAGPIGLFAVQLAKILGASDVVALDIVPEKLDVAVRFGARAAFRTVAEALAERPDGFDVVVETAGVNAGEETAVLLAGRHGRVVFVGIPNAPVTLSERAFDRVLRYEIHLIGSWNSMSSPFPGSGWRTIVELFASGRLRGIEMVTDEVTVMDLPELLPHLADRTEFHLKALVVPVR
jgi:L-iditol 2-dehydrogenase